MYINAQAEETAAEITPYSSDVFSTYYGTITNTHISCYAQLKSSRTLTMQTILQKYNTSDGTWRNYDAGDTATTYTNVKSKTHYYYCTAASSGSYRCKYIIKGTVNGNTSTVIGFSTVKVV